MTKPVSAEKYIQTRARMLPIDRCLINADWESERLAFVLVIRKHTNGNFTFAGYWVDLLCLGVRDSFYEFNVSPGDLKGYLDANSEEIEMIDVDYSLAHNIIFAGHEFAAEYHIAQHPAFGKTTQFLLEEDSEDIPLIEVHTGDENGLPHLMVQASNLQSAALAKLKQYAGEGNYRYTVVEEGEGDEVLEDEEDDMDDDSWDDDDMDDEEGDDEETDFLFWNALEWEAFIKNFSAENRHLFSAQISHIFLNTATWPALKGRGIVLKDMFEAAGRRIDWGNMFEQENWAYSNEEKEELEKIYYGLIGGTEVGDILSKTRDEIRKGIVKWPSNPLFRLNLYSLWQIKGDYKAATEELIEIVRLFPDYLVGKTSYSEWLMANGRAEEVPALFSSRHSLAELYPDRQHFHISEFVHFNSAWLAYYLHIGDLYLADFFGFLLERLPEEALQDRQRKLLEKLMVQRGAWVIGLIDAAQKDHVKLEVLIQDLIESGKQLRDLYPGKG